MGRALLLTVIGLALATGVITLARGDGLNQAARKQALSETEAIAHEAAESGFAATAAAVVTDLTARPSASGVRLSSGPEFGQYDTRANDTSHGTVAISAMGIYQKARYAIDGEVLELYRTGAPLVAHAHEVKVEAKNSATISGVDHRPPSVDPALLAGPAPPHPAIAFTDSTTRANTLAAASAGTLASLSTEGGKTALLPRPDAVHALVTTALASATALRFPTLSAETVTFGSPSAPATVIVSGNAEFKEGAVGYGLLIVDGDLKFEKDAHWEGLVVMRAESNQKSKLQVKDDARVVGAVVLLGDEALREEPDTQGLPGGHFDLDIFSGSGIPLDRDYHKHEYDDSYNLTYLDFFTAPDLSPDFAAFKSSMGTRPIRVEFKNDFNASGTFAITAGASSWSGLSSGGFNQTISLADLTQMRVDFVSLLELRGTYPGRVSKDGIERDRAFTIRFFDGPTLVYSVSAYEHTKGDPRDGMAAGVPGAEPVELYGEFDVKLDEGALLYSEEAMGRLGRVYPEVRGATWTQVIVRRSVPLRR